MSGKTLLAALARWAVGAVLLLGFIAGVIVLMLWLGGKFSPKVPISASPGTGEPKEAVGRVVRAYFRRVAAPRIRHGDDPCRA